MTLWLFRPPVCGGTGDGGVWKEGQDVVYDPLFRNKVTSGVPTNTSVLSTAKLYKVPSMSEISRLCQSFTETCVFAFSARIMCFRETLNMCMCARGLGGTGGGLLE